MMHSYNPLLDALPLSLSHLNNQEGEDYDAPFGTKGDLQPIFGDKFIKTGLRTGEKVFAPITSPTKGQTEKVLKRGKEVLNLIKTTPDERHRSASQSSSTSPAFDNPSPLHRNAPTTIPMAAIAAPTAPGPPRGHVSAVPVGQAPPVQPVDAADSHASSEIQGYHEMEDLAQPETRQSDETLSPAPNSVAHTIKDQNDLVSGDNGVRVGEGDDENEDDEVAETREHNQNASNALDPHSRDAEAQIDDEESYFAVPGGPGVLNLDIVDGNDPDAFFHPATKEPQPILWLPDDELGLCAAEIKANREMGVESSSRRARLDGKGKVRITGPPPKRRAAGPSGGAAAGGSAIAGTGARV